MSKDTDFLDDLIVQVKPKGQLVGKFQPKARPKNAKAPPIPPRSSKDTCQTPLEPSQTSNNALQTPQESFQASEDAVPTLPIAAGSRVTDTGVEIQMDFPTSQPFQAASSSPAAPDQPATQEHVNQADASDFGPLASKEGRKETVYHEISVDWQDADSLFELDDDIGGPSIPGSVTDDKTQEELHRREKRANPVEVSQDTEYDSDNNKNLQFNHHEPEAMPLGNVSDMGSYALSSHSDDASGVNESLEVTNLSTIRSDVNHESELDDSYKSSGCLTSDALDGCFSLDDSKLQSLHNGLRNEDMMVFSGFESVDEVSLGTTAVTDANKSHSEFMPLRKDKKGKSVSFILPHSSEAVSVIGSFSETMDHCFSPTMTDACAEDLLQSSSVLDDYRDNQMDQPVLEAEKNSEHVGLEIFDSFVSKTSANTGKFQPKPRTRKNTAKFNTSAANIGLMDVLSQQESQTGEPERLEILASETIEDSCIDQSTSLEEELGFEVELQDVEDMNQGTQEVSISPEAGELTRILRKRTEKSSSSAEVAADDDWDFIFQVDEVQNDDGDDLDADEPKKRTQKKMLKTPESEKPVRRRKRTPEKLDSTAEKPQKKKLPHGTKRKRRQVNKTLLETPEEEINPRQLPIKDLIMLAETKERISNKTGASFGKSFSGQSKNSFFNDNEMDFLREDQEQNHEVNEANYNVQETQKKLNYHSYMNRPRTTRWSKTETDLLYQAIREFGTNFAMIEQLFPNRTRHQVKLKFKTEERKNPLLIHDALHCRSKDHSLFNQVIEQIRIKKEQSSNQDMQDDAANIPQDASNENQELGAELHKDEGESCLDQHQEANVSKDELDNLTNRDENDGVFHWDNDDDFFPEDVEKKDSWEWD